MDKVYLELRKSFLPWKNSNKKVLCKNLENYYNENATRKKIVKVSIINNKIYSDYSYVDTFYKLRAKIIIELFDIALNEIIKRNIILGNFTFYFTVNDYNVSSVLPIFNGEFFGCFDAHHLFLFQSKRNFYATFQSIFNFSHL